MHKEAKESFFRIISIFLNLLFNIFVTRLLSVEERGVYGVIINDGNLIAQIFNFGLQTSCLYFLSRDSSKIHTYITSTFVLMFLSNLLYVAIVFLFGSFSLSHLFVALMSTFTLSSMFYVSAAVSINKANHYNYAEIIKTIVLFVSIFIFLKFYSSIYFVFTLFSVVNVIFYLYVVLFIFKFKRKELHLKNALVFTSKNMPISGRSYCSSLFAILPAWYCVYYFSLLFESKQITSDEFGHFILAFNHIPYVTMIFTSISLIFTPKIVSQLNYSDSFRKTSHLLLINFFIMSLGVIFFYFFMDDLFAFMYGEKQREAGIIFNNLIPVCYLLIFLASVSPLMVYLKMPSLSVYIPLISFFIFLGLVRLELFDNTILNNVITSYTQAVFFWAISYMLFFLGKFIKNRSIKCKTAL
jgi:O-antigen/teichoic acid export membrane protein